MKKQLQVRVLRIRCKLNAAGIIVLEILIRQDHALSRIYFILTQTKLWGKLKTYNRSSNKSNAIHRNQTSTYLHICIQNEKRNTI